MVEVSKSRLDNLLKYERGVEVMQNELDIERQSKSDIIYWAEGIRQHNTSLLASLKKISREDAERTQFLVNKRLGRIGEI